MVLSAHAVMLWNAPSQPLVDGLKPHDSRNANTLIPGAGDHVSVVVLVPFGSQVNGFGALAFGTGENAGDIPSPMKMSSITTDPLVLKFSSLQLFEVRI